MEKIKKAFSLIVVMIFLCQNISFGIQEGSFALRPPSHFSQATEEYIGSQNEGGLKQKLNHPPVTPIEELAAREGKRIIFSLPAKPEEKYQLLIQEDKEGIVYPAGMATGIYADDDGIMNLEWVSVLDYPSILEEIKSYRNQCREGTSLVDAMALYFMLGPHTEYRHQIKFLYAYFTSKLNIGTDKEITRFFKNAPHGLEKKWIRQCYS